MKLKKVAVVLISASMIASMSLTGCGKINENATVATLGDTEISLGYANFAAHYGQYNYDIYLGSYYGDGYWTSDSLADDDGNTLEDSVKSDIMDSIEEDYLLEQHMEEYGVEITDDEKAQITEAAEQFMSDNTKSAIKEMGATQEYVEKYLYYYLVENKMTAAIKESANIEISDEEAAQRTFSYVEIDTGSYTDDEGNTVDYTDEEKEELNRTATALAELAQTDGLESAAEAYSYSTYTYSYGSDEESEEDGGFCDAVIAAADDMSEGEVSGVIEGTDCYYIISLDSEYDEEATETKRESLKSSAETDYFNDILQGYKDEADFTVDEDQWAKVTFDVMFTAPEEDTDTTTTDDDGTGTTVTTAGEVTGEDDSSAAAE